jgi:hypothetical protein
MPDLGMPHSRRTSCPHDLKLSHHHTSPNSSGLPAVSRESATLLGRALVADSVLGRARPTLLRWLADAGGGGKARQEVQAATVRAKAIKLLGGAIEADVRVLQMQEVQVRRRQRIHALPQAGRSLAGTAL